MTDSVLILRKPGNGNRICDILFSAVLLFFYLPAAEQTPTDPVPTEKALKQFLPKAAV
jgi:hypothetical protein